MGGSYRQCLQCGKRALSIATRCPGCGCELPAPLVPESGGVPQLADRVTPKGVAVALAVAAVFVSIMLGPSQPGDEQSAAVAADSAVAIAEVASSMAAVAAPLDESASELRVARTWTHVRKTRSVKGELEAILTPGDTVVADSLSRGWYRVALEGEVLGYAHRSTLAEPGT